jgi:spore maturation protein CgeB
MLADRLDIVVLGLSITSSWGNGHATTYRSLLRALARRGHRILFLERDVPWYADNRDLPRPDFCQVGLYQSLDDLRARHGNAVRQADVCIVGSFVPDGVAVSQWVLNTARGRRIFYDIDTPETLVALATGRCEYLSAALIPRFDLYLSFTGGGTLVRLEQEFGARRARALYCSVDPETYRPDAQPDAGETSWDLGYMGTYSLDRQPLVDALLLEPARRRSQRRFVVAGPMYPADLTWPANVERIAHVSPAEHRRFYGRQRFTLNVTRASMTVAGYAPSVRLFEAAACGVPIISDSWPGLDTLFTPGEEIVIARTAADTLAALDGMDERARQQLGQAARQRVLQAHTAAHRAAELEQHLEALGRARKPAGLSGAAIEPKPLPETG